MEVSTMQRTEVMALTSRHRDACTKQYEWHAVAKECTRVLNELPADAGVAADEEIHPDEDGAADPRLWYTRGGDGIQEHPRFLLPSGRRRYGYILRLSISRARGGIRLQAERRLHVCPVVKRPGCSLLPS